MNDYEKIALVLIEELKQMSIDESIELTMPRLAEIKFEHLKVDSLETIQLAMSLEDRLGITLEMSEFPKSATLAEFVDFILTLKK
jgi:acyl carrier protein